jgi:catecholate siderophore receptor
VTGAAFTNEHNVRTNRTAPNSPTTLLNPNPDDPYTGTITVSPFEGRITGNTQALWLFDTAKFGQKWEATGGLRWERFTVDGVTTAPAPIQQNVNMKSLRAGLIHKPVQHGSIYASYGSSLSPSLEGLSYSTFNTNIPPEKTYTTEVGTKWDLAGNRLLVTGAVFRVAKDNARTPGILPTDPPQVLSGRQVSQGVELSASGAITRSLRVLGAYSLIDARIRSSNTPAEVGRFFQNTPRNSASVWATYTAKRFTAGVGPRFMGKRFGNNTNTRKVDAYATVDAMVSYRVHERLDLRLNLSNLNNADYFERLSGGHLIPGASRYVLMTTNFHF